MSIFEMWVAAITQPREETFARIAVQPTATVGNALMWVAVSSLISGMVAAIGQAFSMRSIFSNFSNYMPQGFGSFGIGTIICGVPLAVVFGVLGFVIANP